MARTWWKEAVIYQIYPRSFMDSNGDGIGDLPGIISRLDYLAYLGVDVLWLSPIFRSPNADNGYDISDYTAIMEAFGTMADFERLVREAHRRNMKVLLDIVLNHSSDEHPWFQQSRSSKDNPYRDFYFWQPHPPNRWQSFFGGSAWQHDPTTDAYYLHLFSPKQPDLNWENPQLRRQIYRFMRFWLDKGVDGFRLDVIPLISKRTHWPEGYADDFLRTVREVYANGPRVHEYLQEMHREVFAPYDALALGEGIGLTPDTCLDYVGAHRRELHVLYHFDHLFINFGPGGRFDPVPWKLSEFKAIFRRWDEAIGEEGWINIVLDNHDFPRMLSRFGDDHTYHEASAKLLATLLLTLRGTPCIYQGSELGMTNARWHNLEELRDIEALNAWRAWQRAGRHERQAFLEAAAINGRDNARTPMQWTDAHAAGFTTGTPWIKVNDNYTRINARRALADADSIFHYYRHMLALRKAHPTLVYGSYRPLREEDEQLFAYERADADGRYLVLLNFGSTTYPVAELVPPTHRWLIGNYAMPTSAVEPLRPWEARVLEVGS